MSAAFRCVCAVGVVVAAVPQARSVRVPEAFDWQAASPESQSVSGRALDDLRDRLAAANTKAFLVVRNDRVILEWYAPDPDARFEGGFAVYDAPEPWGPWTRAYFTERWDGGPGESSSFPTKWMDASGTTAHLVFSGEDAFSVRRATVVLR